MVKESRCSFCGASEKDVLLIASNSADKEGISYICPNCAKKLTKHFDEILGSYWNTHNDLFPEFEYEDSDYDDSEEEKYAPSRIVKPSEVYNNLNQYVIGQEEAKKTLSVAVYNHQKRLTDETGLIRKSNILMVGPSGTGKTLLAKTLAKSLDVPFVVADANSLTEAGYVGDDVESILSRLLQVADYDIEKAERGIIFIDEIDKISRKSENPSITRDVSGEGVQNALLKIIEGAEVSVPIGGGRKHPHGDNVIINTEKILFICGGAFEGMIKKNKKKNVIGFNNVAEDTEDEKLSPDMLKKYGMTPELLGRLPILIQLQDLTKEDLCHILTQPKDAIVKEYVELFNRDNIKLEFKDTAIDKIAEMAIERNVGARGLRSIVENLLGDAMFSAPDDESIDKIIVDGNAVDTNTVKYHKKKKIA